MSDSNFLQILFRNQLNSTGSNFERKICDFFFNSSDYNDFIPEEEYIRETPFSEENRAENWKNLLALNLFCYLTNAPRAVISEKIRSLERRFGNQNSGYLRSLAALNHALAQMPVPETGLHLLESGAALIDLHEYSPWLALPYTPQHYEFGIFLCILALLTGKEELKENILRLTKWQLNTLDAKGIPLDGLFVREKDGHPLYCLYLSYLLFRAAFLLSEDPLYQSVSDAALEALGSYPEDDFGPIHPVWPLAEKWLSRFESGPKIPLSLPEYIHDASTALAGYRTPKHRVMCTLHGAQTGLGTLKYNDVEIVNYGPQYFPLADCEGFGIEGNALSDKGIRRSTIERKRQSFILKGCARMVDQPTHISSTSFEFGTFRGIWLEVLQEFKYPDFFLKTNFLGLAGWDSVAFSFFVKAGRCVLPSQKSLLPRTLENYEGNVSPVILEGFEGNLELNPLGFEGNMQVIPLSGSDNFWGADFLISYHLSSARSEYGWHIGPPPMPNG